MRTVLIWEGEALTPDANPRIQDSGTPESSPSRRRTPDEILNQLLSGNPGLRARIDANCVSCVYDEIAPGNWRQQVEGCQLTECPMHPVRPRSTGRGG